MTFKTEQENFWAGDFGREYAQRNRGAQMLASNIEFFARSLRMTRGLSNCLEFGANIGMNLRALQLLYPQVEAHAIEINAEAAAELCQWLPPAQVFQGSILDFKPARPFDLVLIKGVLIHINPAELDAVYQRLAASTGRYLLMAEYYNPTPVSVNYRGHADRLFKRDFCGEMLDRHPELRLLDYGFAYHRDPAFPQDDLNWFLLEKTR